jgi:hypothetical protein
MEITDMFRNAPAAEEVATRVATLSDNLIPLSHFELDHPRPAEGWPNYLGVRGIAIRPDHIGRDAISSHDASRLIGEQREAEIRRQKLAKLAEQEAVRADYERRSRVWKVSPRRRYPQV